MSSEISGEGINAGIIPQVIVHMPAEWQRE